MIKVQCKVQFEFVKIPKILESIAKNEYIRLRNEATKIFNEHIGEVNNEWRSKGKKASFGDSYKNINPEYVQFIVDKIQPLIDETVNSKAGMFEIYIGEYADFYGRMKHVEGSKIIMDILEMK